MDLENIKTNIVTKFCDDCIDVEAFRVFTSCLGELVKGN